MIAHLSAHIPTALGRNSALHLLRVGGVVGVAFADEEAYQADPRWAGRRRQTTEGRYGSGKSVGLSLATSLGKAPFLERCCGQWVFYVSLSALSVTLVIICRFQSALPISFI